MKVAKHQFSPIQIVLETPEEVQIMLDALNEYAQADGPGERLVADLMYNQLFFHARLLS